MDTIAMIGSPAARGAVASAACAWRACVARASAVNAVSAATVASVTMPAGRRYRVATVDCAVANRLTIHCSVEISVRAYVDQVPDRDSWKLTAATVTSKGGGASRSETCQRRPFGRKGTSERGHTNFR